MVIGMVGMKERLTQQTPEHLRDTESWIHKDRSFQAIPVSSLVLEIKKNQVQKGELISFLSHVRAVLSVYVPDGENGINKWKKL